MTEHEIALQKARREGWTACRKHMWESESGWWNDCGREQAENEAAKRFPITVTRPRVVERKGVEWRYTGDGVFECRSKTYPTWTQHWAVPETVRLLADLLNNPTEEVAE